MIITEETAMALNSNIERLLAIINAKKAVKSNKRTKAQIKADAADNLNAKLLRKRK